MEIIERVIEFADAKTTERLCEMVTMVSECCDCSVDSIRQPGNEWLHATIAVVVLKIFIHVCWFYDVASAGENARGYMWRNWIISAFVSAVTTFLILDPSAPSGFFSALEHVYIPLTIRVIERHNVEFRD